MYAHTFTPICSSRGAVVRRVDLFSDFLQSMQAAGFFRERVDGALGHMGSPSVTVSYEGTHCTTSAHESGVTLNLNAAEVSSVC